MCKFVGEMSAVGVDQSRLSDPACCWVGDFQWVRAVLGGAVRLVQIRGFVEVASDEHGYPCVTHHH